MTTQLRRVVTVTLDPSQEIGDLEAGPVFTDEYTTLVCSDDPADLDNLLRLDGIQEELVTDYLTEWSRVAAKMAEQENIDLYVAVAAVEPCDENDPLSVSLRERVSSQLHVSGGGDTWFITSPLTRGNVHATN